MVLELKAKAPAVIAMGAHGAAPVMAAGDRAGDRTGGGAAASAAGEAGGGAQAQADALSALVNLGYGPGEAAAAIAGRGGARMRRG